MKRHLNTHSRRRTVRPTVFESSTSVIEDNVENTESIIPDNEPERTEPAQPEPDTDEQTTNVQYTRDPLEAVREGTNTLYVMPILIS